MLEAGFLYGGDRDGSFAVGTDDVAISPGGTVYGIESTPARIVATFRARFFHPGHASQSVPTSVALHDGSFYIGQLGGGTPPGAVARLEGRPAQ